MDSSRRAVLATVATATLAGCVSRSDLPSWLPHTGHPLAGTSRVTVVDDTAGGRNLEPITETALEFWTENAYQYVGFEVTFVRADEDPHVELVYTDDIESCGDLGTEDILGCAPMLSASSRIDPPVTATVLVGTRPDASIRRTTKHELGHLLGLGHDDEPAAVMSNDPRDRLEGYDDRLAVLERFREAVEQTNEGTLAYNEGIEYWQAESDGRAKERFDAAGTKYSAGLSALEAATPALEALRDIETVDATAVERGLAAATERLEYSHEAALEMEQAATKRADGRPHAANNHLSAANDASGRASEIEVPHVGAIAQALGLVRGTDEDDRIT